MKEATCTNTNSTVTTRNTLNILLGIVLFIISTNVAGQNKWSVEFRPGVNFPTNKLGNINLKTGFGAEGTLAYRFMPNLSVYGGWSWNKFASSESFSGSAIEFEETGYSFGLQFIRPFQNSGIGYMLRGGGIYNHIETENSEGSIVDDSGHGFGWQIGGGLAVPLGSNWRLLPELRYRSLSRTIEINTVKTAVDLNYVSAGLGIAYTF